MDTPKIERCEISAYRIPTDEIESDGTLTWKATTLVLVRLEADGIEGLGFTYSDVAAAHLIQGILAPLLKKEKSFDIATIWERGRRALRNVGYPGVGAAALSALDTALWDLKAKALHLPLVSLFGQARPSIAAYGSGGFTSYSLEQLRAQAAGWSRSGLKQVKIKVGRAPQDDPARIRAVREAMGSEMEIFFDANGALHPTQALRLAEIFHDLGVTWFEEPVSSDDLEGLRLIRKKVPPGIDIAAGEYGWDAAYFSRMLAAQAVDVLQADATRCGGYTGFLQADALAQAHGTPLSSHCAPAFHLPVCCAAQAIRHMEFFHDHVRIERMLFDGVAELREGRLFPDLDRPGHGLKLRDSDARRFLIYRETVI